MILNEVITDIAAGPFGSNLKVECFVPEGFPIIDGANLKGFKVTDNITKFVTEDKARSLHRSIAKRGDVISTISGTLGQIAYIPDDSKYEEYLVSQRQFRITFNTEKVNVPFLVYYFHSRIGQSKILAFANQVGVPALAQPLKNFRNIEVNFPPIDIQNKIASILCSLDDKIAVNKKICENLEAQARVLFKHWFVDFAPFKDGKFVESELGLIPEGWKVAKIKDIPHTLNTGKRPKGGAITSGVPSIGAEQLKGLCNYDYTKTKYISEEFSKSIPKGKVMGYEVYLNRVGGKPGDYIQNTTMFGEGYPYENCYLNDHVFKLDFMQNRGYNVFIYFTFLTSRIQKYLNACGGKAAIPVINKQNIDDIYVFSPENEYVIKFGESILPMINMIFKIGVESARLASLRDTLLPKLMSGQIKVNEIAL